MADIFPDPYALDTPSEDPQTRTLDQIFDHFRAHPSTDDVADPHAAPDVMTYFQVVDPQEPNPSLLLFPSRERWLCAECLAERVFDHSVTVRASLQTAEPFFCHDCRDAEAEVATIHDELRRLPR